MVQRSILELTCDAAVSPANSFGFMNGGIDGVYMRHFGFEIETRVRTAIAELHHGELLVGAAEIVPTNDARIPYLIAAPTMRVPQALRNSVNPYLAMRAVLLLIRHGTVRVGPQAGRAVCELVRHVAVPGLGTGVGEIPTQVCAVQVRAAIEDVLMRDVALPRDWGVAQERHYDLAQPTQK